MKKVSIIVPVYNEEKNLQRCIDSLIDQTYRKLEILIINDGSTDNSDKIMDSYNDKRLICIHKENTGIGATRNLGIEKATGDYIMFVDSDDYIELNCVESMLNSAEKNNCDLVVSNYFLDVPNKSFEIKFHDFGVTSLKKEPDLLTYINLGPCNKIYRKELFKNNRFPTNLKYEDAPVVVQAVCDAKRICFNDLCLFHYVIKKTGETITRDARIFDILKICELIENKLKNRKYVYKTNLFVKMLSYYLKNSRYIPEKNMRNKFIDQVYNFLDNTDKKWRNCTYFKREKNTARLFIKHKILLKILNEIKK